MSQDPNIAHAPRSATSGWDGASYWLTNVDSEGRLIVRNTVWDSDALSWVAETGGSSTGGGTATVAYEQVAYDVDSDPMFTGGLKADGSWYITKITGGRKTFITGSSGFVTAWASRAAHSYDEYDVEF